MLAPADLRWELLVVDNGSTDGTADVVAGFRDRLPVRCVREDRAGLSHARNRGVEEARGEYICWTDDDVVIDPGWLGGYARAFRSHPEAALFGGRIDPVLQAPINAWFARLADVWPLTNLLAQRDLGPEEVPLRFDDGYIPWGANYAVRTAEQREVRYDPNLGVSPLQRRLGEESEVIFQLMALGATGWWVPDARVSHLIPPERQTWRYIYQYFRSYGETLRYLEAVQPGRHHMPTHRKEAALVTGRPARLYGRAGVEALLFAASRVVRADRRSTIHLRRLAVSLGAAAAAREEPRRAPAGAGT